MATYICSGSVSLVSLVSLVSAVRPGDQGDQGLAVRGGSLQGGSEL